MLYCIKWAKIKKVPTDRIPEYVFERVTFTFPFLIITGILTCWVSFLGKLWYHHEPLFTKSPTNLTTLIIVHP